MTWQVRYTWEPLDGTPHPKLTYGDSLSQESAIGQARAAIARQKNSQHLRLVEVHVRPISSNDWTKVEESAPIEIAASG